MLDKEMSFWQKLKDLYIQYTQYISSKTSETKQLEYLAQSIKLEEHNNLYILRLSIIVICLSCFTFIVWAAFTEISEVAKTKGEVVPQGFVHVIQNFQGGVIDQIHVQDGQLVKKDQVLIEINDKTVEYDLAEAKIKYASLAMQVERLNAIIQNREPDFTKIFPQIPELIDNQMSLYKARIDTLSVDSKILQEQIAQKAAELQQLESKKISIEENLALAREALQLQTELNKGGHTSRLTLLQYQKDENEVEESFHEVVSDISKAKRALAEYQNRFASLVADRNNKLLLELDNAESDAARQKEYIAKLEENIKQLNIKAPIDGLVQGLKISSLGGIIKPGETVMEIVPVGGNLIVETRIAPKDIGYVHKSQEVDVKITSYNFTRYGSVKGSLEFISATTFNDENGRPYYLGRINLLHNYVGKDQKNTILPGMQVEADIITGKKTVLEYLLKPIHVAMKSSFTER